MPLFFDPLHLGKNKQKKGVVAAFRQDVPEGHELSFDAAIASDVPLGGGLSSSAALEVSLATLLEEITGVKVSGVEKALRQATCFLRAAPLPGSFRVRDWRVICQAGVSVWAARCEMKCVFCWHVC